MIKTSDSLTKSVAVMLCFMMCFVSCTTYDVRVARATITSGTVVYDNHFFSDKPAKVRLKYDKDMDGQIIKDKQFWIGDEEIYGAIYVRCPWVYYSVNWSENEMADRLGLDLDPSIYNTDIYPSVNCKVSISDSKNDQKYMLTEPYIPEEDDPPEDIDELFNDSIISDFSRYRFAGYGAWYYNEKGERFDQKKVVFKRGRTVYIHLDFCCDYRIYNRDTKTETKYRAVDEGSCILSCKVYPDDLGKPELYAFCKNGVVYLCYHIEGKNCITQYKYKKGKWKNIPKATGKSKPIVKCKFADDNIDDFMVRCMTWEKMNGKKVYSKWSRAVKISSTMDGNWGNRDGNW